MKVVLAALNAKYIHSNLAIRCLRAYANKYKENILLKEFTINHYSDDILSELYKEKPDMIGFSTYIWNLSMVKELGIELKKVLPNTKIWLGGPEVSYDGREFLLENHYVDGIMVGEGEETFKEVLDYYHNEISDLKQVNGIIYRQTARKDYQPALSLHSVATSNAEEEEAIIETRVRMPLNLSNIPFCYDDMSEMENKIIYYESSRGCPYSCSYCLSSIDKKVRFRDTELVKRELDVFLKHKVPQVKFVDRTFNCNRNHTLAIWKHIMENDNRVTNFHFEISADILNDEEIKVLNSMRPGLVQLEIGVQSTNDETIDAISRSMSFNKLKGIVGRIHEGENVHIHLDLIAGLPFESYEIFKQSFNEVYKLKPDQFQLGFLKVLKGSKMFMDSAEYNIVYKSQPPYEVLYTKWLSYDDVLSLKGLENMVEVYYNSGQFITACTYMEHFFKTPFELYEALANYYESNHLNGLNHSRLKRFEILIDFLSKENEKGLNIDIKSFKSILVHDMYLRERLKSRPSFASDIEPYKKLYKDFYYEDKLYDYLGVEPTAYTVNELRSSTHIEHFDLNVVKTAETGVIVKEDQFILYDYLNRNPLNYEARYQVIKL